MPVLHTTVIRSRREKLTKDSEEYFDLEFLNLIKPKNHFVNT